MGLLMDPDLIAVRTAKFRPDGWTPPTQEGDRKQFLAVHVVSDRQDSRSATVRDLIGHYANRLGGVHWDPNSRKDSDNSTLREAFVEYEDNLRLCLSSIARIVIRALDPLAAKAYLASLTAERGGTSFG